MSNYRIFGDGWDFRVQQDHYERFFNQQLKGVPRRDQPIFQFDYQTFLWGFLVGISSGKPEPLSGSTKTFAKWSTWARQPHLVNRMIALVLGYLFRETPEGIQEDYKNNELGPKVRETIEGFANAGFGVMTHQKVIQPDYFNDGSNLSRQILDHLQEVDPAED
jgi:hypothetical protein